MNFIIHLQSINMFIGICHINQMLKSQTKPPYAMQHSVFILNYINLHNMFRPLMAAILKCNHNCI
jgi:hypothetical protein